MIRLAKNLLSNAVFVCGGIFLVSVTALAAALTAQFAFGLDPCPLCLYQRVPYVLAALFAVGGLAAAHAPERLKISAFLVFLCGLCFLAGGVIAFYHAGVEQHWWTSFLEGCAVNFALDDPKGLMALIEAKPAVRCDEIPWADPVLGLSMAAYNAMASAGLAAGSVAASILIARKANGFL